MEPSSHLTWGIKNRTRDKQSPDRMMTKIFKLGVVCKLTMKQEGVMVNSYEINE